MKHLLLSGFMGSGKSTLGPLVANLLQRPFVDLDQQIEQHLGQSILDIFETKGEWYFRQQEARLAKEFFLYETPLVIALGGGTLLWPNTARLAKQRGILIYLDAPFSVIANRVKQSRIHRPLLKHLSLKELYLERLPLKALAHEVIHTHLEDPQTTATQITQYVSAYPSIFIQNNALQQLPHWLSQRAKAPKVALLSIPPLQNKAKEIQIALNKQGFQVFLNILPDGEGLKNLQTYEHICLELKEKHFKKEDTLLALGGGSLLDVAGFVASTYHRGMNFVALPSTLLAMIDACVGGKNGVHMNSHKNQLGTFYPPKGVLMDPLLLGTLPKREWQSGMGEALKHGMLKDEALFNWVVQGPHEPLDAFIKALVQVKLDIIEMDPFEEHERLWLNLGHTLGHGIESASEFKMPHGVAVALGILYETQVGIKAGIGSENWLNTLKQALYKLDFPTQIPKNISKNRICGAILHDKKWQQKGLHIPLCKAPGERELLRLPSGQALLEML